MIAIDTNIFAYAAFPQPDPRKTLAVAILTRSSLIDVVVPIQAFVEFGNASLKRRQLTASAAAKRIAEWSATFPAAATRPEHVVQALALVESDQLAYFDALILVVSAGAGATTLISEDMRDGGVHAGVRVINPFNSANTAEIERLLALS